MQAEPVTIACVVEGHGEVPGLPKLLYRIAHEFSIWDLRVPPPFRRPRGSLVAAESSAQWTLKRAELAPPEACWCCWTPTMTAPPTSVRRF